MVSSMLGNFTGSDITNITRYIVFVRVCDSLCLFDGYEANYGECSSLLSNAVDDLVSTQAHGMIDMFVTGSATGV